VSRERGKERQSESASKRRKVRVVGAKKTRANSQRGGQSSREGDAVSIGVGQTET